MRVDGELDAALHHPSHGAVLLPRPIHRPMVGGEFALHVRFAGGHHARGRGGQCRDSAQFFLHLSFPPIFYLLQMISFGENI